MTQQIYKNTPDKAQAPIIIAGPCSAENEEQLLATAEGISKLPMVSIFRAGIWKPRTKPGSFEGVGEKAFPWLKKVKEKYGFKTAVEIAKPEHVELCLSNPESIDMLWIGARTTGNPFSVQAIADALRGVDIPVMIKNPINPDLALWIGATQRIMQAGVTNILAIHRGFYPFSETYLRNIPKWEIAIDYRIEFPEIPMINDPSHISGSQIYIRNIAQKALDLNFNGLMIETHYCPEKAKSDAEQQLTPEQLGRILNALQYRKPMGDEPENDQLLNDFRDQIDSIDYQLLELLAKRMQVTENIGKYKQENNISIFQLKRWIGIIESRLEFGKQFGMHETFVKNLLQLVHQESIRQQAEIMNGAS
jgi:chorismate mutase